MPWRGMAIDAGARGEEEISRMAHQIEQEHQYADYCAYRNHEPDVSQCRLCGRPEWEPETKDGICRKCRWSK